MIRKFYSLSITAILTFIFGSLAIISSFIPKVTVNNSYIFGHWWARSLLFMGGVKYNVKGIEKIDYNKPTVVMCTHRSHFDILGLMSSTRHPVSFIAKQELRKIPIFGYSLECLGMVYLDRSSKEAARNSITKAANQIKEGRIVVMFPEGTRSEDGKTLQSLKKGGFHLIKEAGGYIQPITVLGTERALKKGSLTITPTTITVRYGEPFAVDDKDSIENLMEKTRESLQKLVTQGE